MILRVGFAKTKHWYYPLALAIRWIGGTDASHMYFVDENDLVYQCVLGGVTSPSYADFKTGYDVLEEFPRTLDPEQTVRYRNFCLKNQGGKYSFWILMGYLVAKVLGLAKNPIDSNRLDCAKLTLLGMRELSDVYVGVDMTSDPNLADLGGMLKFFKK